MSVTSASTLPICSWCAKPAKEPSRFLLLHVAIGQRALVLCAACSRRLVRTCTDPLLVGDDFSTLPRIFSGGMVRELYRRIVASLPKAPQGVTRHDDI